MPWLWLLLAACAGAASRRIRLHGWHLELEENRAIRSPYYDECKFYKGRVLNEPDSIATVTECAGHLYGLLQVGGQEFVLQPNAQESHVVRRRDVMVADQPAFNLTGDTVTDLDLDFSDDAPTPHVRVRSKPDIEYFQNVQTVTRPLSGPSGLWLELAIVADHTMLKFHGRERVKHYILALMNIVSAIFNDPSLESNMTLVINKLFLYEEKDTIIKFGNVKKSLEGVNKWNYRHLVRLPAESTGWDATVWLTRAPLGGPSGFAPVGGVCTRVRSAAIDRDEGLTSAFVIAHELAHLLGLTHDGEAQCPNEASHGSVMAPTVLATLHNYAWSKCSKKQFHEKSKKWWCLQQRSQDEGVVLGGAREVSNYVFTMDEQCRMEFGEGFSVCKSVKVRSACSRLWCAHRAVPQVCRSKRGPPLEGTPCGNNQWCVDEVCEPMPGQKSKDKHDTKPEWGEWSSWTACNSACGYGLRSRSRRCWNNGVISVSDCEGAGSQVATCWAGEPCAAQRDMRADQCARQDSRLIPYWHTNEAKHCEVWCVDFAGSEALSYGALPDGTPCSYQRPYDVCFQGTCVMGHCNSTDTNCNWCPDGYCNNNTNEYSRPLHKAWSRVTMVPHEAHELSIHIASPIPIIIAIREKKRDRHSVLLSQHAKRYEIPDNENNYLKYDPDVPENLQIIDVDNHVIDIKERFGSEGSIVSAGTVLQWKQTETDIFLTAVSRLQGDLILMAIPENLDQLQQPMMMEVTVNYSTPIPTSGKTRPLEYRWSTDRGPCSVSCGGGMRVVRARCPRDQKCAPPHYERCNTHSCEFIWSPGEWESCSATCGTEGFQERQLFCVPAVTRALSRSELVRTSTSPALCTALKPVTRQPCNRLPCPVYWREMPWTECSTTCGRGVSTRPLVCPASEPFLCGPKPRERRRRCRLRRCPLPSRLTHSCPSEDHAQYCELFAVGELLRNCQMPPFRKYCCNVCQSLDRNSG